MKGCRALTDSEIEIMLRSFKGKNALRDKALFIFGIKEGYRISEILSVKVRDVFKGEKVLDSITVKRANMKGKLEGRTLVLHPDVKKALSDWLLVLSKEEGFSPDMYLFRSRKGGNRPISRVQAFRILKEKFSENNMTGNLGTHSLRKSFCAKVYEKLGHDLVSTQKATGHRNIQSLISYLSFDEEKVKEAILSL